MANTPQSRKRVQQAETARERNKMQRTLVRTKIKKVRSAIANNDAAGARQAFADAKPIIDRMAGKGQIHKNKAARHKSRLNAQIKAIS